LIPTVRRIHCRRTRPFAGTNTLKRSPALGQALKWT